jgi:hypothetical protein
VVRAANGGCRSANEGRASRHAADCWVRELIEEFCVLEGLKA